MRPQKFVTQINTWDLIKKNQVNIRRLTNSLSHWVKHQWLVFTLGITGVRESVETRVVGMRSLISCMTRNNPYRIALFVTPRPERCTVHVTVGSHMCTKGFLNYLSDIVVFFNVVFKDEIVKFSNNFGTVKPEKNVKFLKIEKG